MGTPGDQFGDNDEEDGDPAGSADGGAADAGLSAARRAGICNWLSGKRGWVLIVALALAQAIFALVMLNLRTDGNSVSEVRFHTVQELAADMLGREVKFKNIYQSVPARAGKRISLGLEIVLVLGQLPEERIEGAERPTPEEFEHFSAAVQAMEPRVRSRLNTLLQSIPPDRYGGTEVLKTIKEDIRDSINHDLEGLDFGKAVRPGIGKRRVTEVLLPLFLRQES